MARVRLSALGIALAAATAGAQPAAVQPPAGWRALPAMADAAKQAASSGGATVAAAQAWGEPARGCYALAITVGGGAGKPDGLAQELAAAFVGDPKLAGVKIHDAKTDASGASLAFERGAYRGILRARATAPGGRDAVTALACFWNEREPQACETACARMWK